MRDCQGPTPEAKLTMDVAIGPGDPVCAQPARACSASFANAAINTFGTGCIKSHFGTVFGYAAVWTIQREKLCP